MPPNGMTPPRGFLEVPIGARKGSCASCRAAIYWIQTAAGKWAPVDCAIEGGAEPTAEAPGLGISHFATCADAALFRRR